MLGYNHFFYGTDSQLYCDGVSVTDIANQVSTPVYIYSAKHLRDQYQLFAKNLPNCLIAFAVKACPNIAILKLLGELGCGADIVSGGEMRRALKAGIAPKKIMFSGVGKTSEEIEFALNNKIGMLNVESEGELENIAKIAADMNIQAPISLRINPDVLTQTLPGISTGKKGDKFGIPQKDCLRLFKKFYHHKHLNFKGIDFHIGSQVLNVDNFAEAFEKMRALVISLQEKEYHITHVDCGGGLGVPYQTDQAPPNIESYAKIVKHYFGDLNVQLAFEPGRFIAANSGILVSKVLYLKQDFSDKNDPWECLIIDAAMNDLARPAMYGAYHHIIPVIENQTMPQAIYDIVGPICESTDTFTKKYPLQVAMPNDLVAFLTAGAYGTSMGSNYNTRLDIPEVLVDEDQTWRIIRKKSTYEHLMSLEVY
ncbi:MAG: diaminopimelate decarboxylase [Alphaproteobacteria bacterium]|jgi:diaminopimelate decarboxylase